MFNASGMKPFIHRAQTRWLLGIAAAAVVLWIFFGSERSSAPNLQSTQNVQTATSESESFRRIRELIKNAFGETGSNGSWCLSGAENIEPCYGLRTQFDDYLAATKASTVTFIDMRLFVQAEASRSASAAQVIKIVSVFDRYWILMQYQWKYPLIENQPDTKAISEVEKRRVRIELLGQAWADAFYPPGELGPGPAKISSEQQSMTELAIENDNWEGISAEEKNRREIEFATFLKMPKPQIGKDNRLEVALYQLQWLQQQTELSDAEKIAAIQEYVEDNFDPQERESVLRALKMPQQ